MELPRIFKISRSRTGKKRTQGRISGFTLIEIIVVIGILVVVATASVRLSFPAIAGLACQLELEGLEVVLDRARFLSVLLKKDIYVETGDIVFRGEEVLLLDSDIFITIGSAGTPCEVVLQINRLGIVI